VVVSIIGLLIAILLPALQGARDAAVRLTCAAQLKQVITASHTYATDFGGDFPDDENRAGPGHRLKQGTSYDLNAAFVVPYIGDQRDTVMFCPGPLYQVRNPTHPQYVEAYVTYQYFNAPLGAPGIVVADQPDLSSVEVASPEQSLWSDLALVTSSGFYFGHDAPITLEPPQRHEQRAGGWLGRLDQLGRRRDVSHQLQHDLPRSPLTAVDRRGPADPASYPLWACRRCVAAWRDRSGTQVTGGAGRYTHQGTADASDHAMLPLPQVRLRLVP